LNYLTLTWKTVKGKVLEILILAKKVLKSSLMMKPNYL